MFENPTVPISPKSLEKAPKTSSDILHFTSKSCSFYLSWSMCAAQEGS